MKKWLVSLLLSTAFASVVPCAGAQTVSLPTSDDPVGDAVETTEGAVETTEGAVQDLSDSVTQGETSGGSPRSSLDRADGTASPGKGFRSRFDRLPPRLERLLERIELGKNVPANLRRLEQALGSLSARERTRLLRLLNAEIRRLRADGVSPAERRRIERLTRARATIATLSDSTSSGSTSTSPVAGVSTGTHVTGRASGTGAPFAGGVQGVSVARSQAPPSEGATPPRDGGVGPSEPSEIPEFPLTEVLLAFCAVLLLIVGALAIKEERAP